MSRIPIALLGALALAGCGGAGAAAPPAAPRAATVKIASFKYAPAVARVRAGGRVTWANADRAGHTATFTSGPSKLETDRLERGQRATLTFPKAGRYAYVCAFHPFMKGEVVVSE